MTSHAETPKTQIEKVYKTDWIKDTALKTGLVSTFCTAQSLSGFTEARRWDTDGKTFIINDDNYHAIKTIKDISWVGAGWFLYANLNSPDLTWRKKICRVTGSALIARNAFEWSYKYGRYGNPFDYSEAHNQHAIVYFKVERGGLVDAYIGTGPFSGPLVDIACMTLGLILIQ